MNATSPQVTALQQRITDEIFLALAMSKTGRLRRWFGGLFYLPTIRFAQIFGGADAEVGRTGMSGGCRAALAGFNIHLEQRGAEAMPTEGPLVVVSNHPGAYDSICLGSCVPRRDLKIVVWETPFYRALVNADSWFIYATNDPTNRMLALRACIQHLQSGGALLIFGTGVIEPDPAFVLGAEQAIEEWSPSIEVMLRKVPETRLVVAIASGVLLPRFARSGLARLRRQPVDQRRLGEVYQIISQLIFPSLLEPPVRLSFAPPITAAQLSTETPGPRLLPAIRARARALLSAHTATWYGRGIL